MEFNPRKTQSLTGLIERGVVALEKMAEEPMVNLEVGLPVCPFCETINPNVYMRETDGLGPLLEIVLYVQCQACKEFFYAVPVDWHMFKARADVEAEMDTRKRAFDGNQR
jgi:hypothetical protein